MRGTVAPPGAALTAVAIERIVSGGQTGVDRAALDVAAELGIPCGGWCPRGRRAEDGAIAPDYPLTETPSQLYVQRTQWNVRDSDVTLVLLRGAPEGGTLLTIHHAERVTRPHRIVDLYGARRIAPIVLWLESNSVAVLNIAGPRESKNPGIYDLARDFLRELLAT